jgi:hypothetical protein
VCSQKHALLILTTCLRAQLITKELAGVVDRYSISDLQRGGTICNHTDIWKSLRVLSPSSSSLSHQPFTAHGKNLSASSVYSLYYARSQVILAALLGGLREGSSGRHHSCDLASRSSPLGCEGIQKVDVGSSSVSKEENLNLPGERCCEISSKRSTREQHESVRLHAWSMHLHVYLTLRRGWTGHCLGRRCELGLTPLGHASTAWVGPPSPWSHAVNALKDQTIGGVPSLTPRIITIPGRRPVPPRPRGFRNPLLVAAHRPRGKAGSLRVPRD